MDIRIVLYEIFDELEDGDRKGRVLRYSWNGEADRDRVTEAIDEALDGLLCENARTAEFRTPFSAEGAG